AADRLAGLLWHRHARARQAARRAHEPRGDAPIRGRRFSRLPLGRRYLSRHGLSRPQRETAAVHRPLLYRRLSDPPRRSARRAGPPATVASGGSELSRSAPRASAAFPLLEELQRIDQGAVDAPQERDANEAPGQRKLERGRSAIVVVIHVLFPQATPTTSSTVS